MFRYKHTYNLIAVLSFAAGLVFSFWYFSLFGLLLAAVAGQYATALLLGLVMDILYGTPVGHWHWLPVPFTAIALLASVAQYVLSRYLLRGDSGTL